MSNLSSLNNAREEIEMLLPWFVTGKLDAGEQLRVEAYLADHPEMLRQIDLIDAERSEAVTNNEAVGVPPAETLARLMGAIDRRSLSRRSGFATVSGAVQNALDWLGSRSALVPVAAAVAVALVLQAGTIGALLWQGSATGKAAPGFQTASAPPMAAEQKGTYVLVGFVPTASIQQIEQFLLPLGITIADGPKAGSIYKLRLSDKTLSDAERELLLTAMKSNTGTVRFAAPAGP